MKPPTPACSAVRRTTDDGPALGLTVQEGKRYMIGARIDGSHVDGWRPDVVAIEDIKNHKRRDHGSKRRDQGSVGQSDVQSDR